MSLQNYINRKYDYLALQGANASREVKLGLELVNAETNGQICVGIQKLSQRWLLELMTEVGSMVGRPDRGTTFMRAVRQGKITNTMAAIAEFELATISVRRNLQNEEYADMPDDERYASAELLNISVLPGYMNLQVQINSVAGSSREIILPISTLPINI